MNWDNLKTAAEALQVPEEELRMVLRAHYDNNILPPMPTLHGGIADRLANPWGLVAGWGKEYGRLKSLLNVTEKLQQILLPLLETGLVNGIRIRHDRLEIHLKEGARFDEGSADRILEEGYAVTKGHFAEGDFFDVDGVSLIPRGHTFFDDLTDDSWRPTDKHTNK